MPGLPAVPSDWNTSQSTTIHGSLGEPMTVKIEAVGQHFQLFSSRKASQRTYSEQERHEEANGIKKEEEEELSEDEDEPAYLATLDPKEWKSQDHYEVMGITRYRYKATEEHIRNAFRKKVLKHHPDKKAQAGGSVDDDSYFKCVQKAFEVLIDPERKRHFDSVDPTFDDRVPSEREINEANFFQVLGPLFEENSRFSKKKPVPLLGDINSSQSEVNKFYDFWYNFDSWRVFNYLDEEEVSGDNRGDKRYMEKKNLKARADRKKEDNARVRQLTDLALKLDPRMKKFKEQEKEKKEAQAKAKERAKEGEELAAKKAKEEALKEQQKLEAQAKAKAEEEKKEREAKKNNVRNYRKKIRQEVKDANYYLATTFGPESKEVLEAMVHLEKVCETASIDDLASLSEIAGKNRAEFEEAYRNQLRKFLDEKALPPKLEQPAVEVQKEREWTDAEHSLLIQAVNLFPGGTVGRWDKITAHFNEHSKLPPRTSKDLTQEATKIKNSKDAVKMMDTNKVVKKHNDTVIKDEPTQRFEEPAKEAGKGKAEAEKGKGKAPTVAAVPHVVENPPKPETASGSAKPSGSDKDAAEDKDEPEGKPWSKEEQQALENALKNFPASVDGRWDKIAAAVGTRNKKQCMLRCKKIAQQIKDKKEAK